jgi:thioredoxin 1
MLGENGVVLVKSEEEFINAMSKAQGKPLHLLSYLTLSGCV